MNSQAVILGSMTVVTIDSGIKSLITDTGVRVPPSRIVIGGFLITIALLMGSEASPKLAEGFAVLLLVAELFGPTGGGLTQAVLAATKGGVPTTAALTTTTPSPLNAVRKV